MDLIERTVPVKIEFTLYPTPPSFIDEIRLKNIHLHNRNYQKHETFLQVNRAPIQNRRKRGERGIRKTIFHSRLGFDESTL